MFSRLLARLGYGKRENCAPEAPPQPPGDLRGPPESTIEISPEYAEKIAAVLSQSDQRPILREPTGPQVAEPQDWADGTVDERPQPLSRENAVTLREEATTARWRAVTPGPWIAPEDEQTTGLILVLDDPSEPPLVLPTDEVVFEFEEALAYLQVGDETNVCFDTGRRGSSLDIVWDDDE